jgi:hypothetical protein
VTIDGVQAGQLYYIRAGAANGGSTGAGSYGIQVNFGGAVQDPVPPPNTVVAEQASQGGGSGNVTIPLDGRGYTLHEIIDKYVAGNLKAKANQVRKLEGALGITNFGAWVNTFVVSLPQAWGYGESYRVDTQGVRTANRFETPQVSSAAAAWPDITGAILLANASLATVEVASANLATTAPSGGFGAQWTQFLERIVDAALNDLDDE